MDINYTGVLPEIILSLVGIWIMLLTPFFPRERQTHLGYLALAGLVLAFLGVGLGWGQTDLAFFDMIFQDDFGQFCKTFSLFVSTVIHPVNSIVVTPI